jgi:hypothetical protein
MLTMRQIWQKTPYDRKEKIPDVRVTKPKFGISKSTKHPTAVAITFSVETENGKPKLFKYATSIEFMPKMYVKVSCSCPDFLYRWEYALWKNGAADIIHSNGEPPIDSNPNNVPGCCKHLLATYSYLVNNGIVDSPAKSKK